MSLPPRPFQTLDEIAIRWSVMPIDVAGYAVDGLIALSIAAPPMKTDTGKIICDLVEVAGADVLPLSARTAQNRRRSCFAACARTARVNGTGSASPTKASWLHRLMCW